MFWNAVFRKVPTACVFRSALFLCSFCDLKHHGGCVQEPCAQRWWMSAEGTGKEDDKAGNQTGIRCCAIFGSHIHNLYSCPTKKHVFNKVFKTFRICLRLECFSILWL